MNKFYFPLFALVVLACTKDSTSSQESLASESIISKTISVEDFQNRLSSTHGAILLDVRTPREFAGGYLEGAINIDFRSDDFQAKINELDKETPYFVYCGSGGRSSGAKDLMRDLNFKEVYDLAGGLQKWRTKGLPSKLP